MNEYVYHYTTIETLALILKNRTIRFNSLANVDDLEEQKARDLMDFGMFCYASCWTLDSKENIALWNMYSKNGLGVRIGMPKNWYALKQFSIPQAEGKSINHENYFGAFTINDQDNNILFNIDPMESLNEMEVIYTDVDRYLEPNIYEMKNNIHTIKWPMLGNVKSELWRFQNEYRYSFCTIPAKVYMAGIQGMGVGEMNHICRNINPYSQFYDIGINDIAFEQMYILVGRSASEAEKIIISSLVATFNDKAKVDYSRLNVRLK